MKLSYEFFNAFTFSLPFPVKFRSFINNVSTDDEVPFECWKYFFVLSHIFCVKVQRYEDIVCVIINKVDQSIHLFWLRLRGETADYTEALESPLPMRRIIPTMVRHVKSSSSGGWRWNELAVAIAPRSYPSLGPWTSDTLCFSSLLTQSSRLLLIRTPCLFTMLRLSSLYSKPNSTHSSYKIYWSVFIPAESEILLPLQMKKKAPLSQITAELRNKYGPIPAMVSNRSAD